MEKIIDKASLRDRIHVFRDRFHAGKLLAEMIRKHVPLDNAILFVIPAGGVPVGYVISRELDLPMELAVVRKIQIPWDPEAGFGAVSWNGDIVLNESLVKQLGLPHAVIDESIESARKIVQERIRNFRGDEPMPDLSRKTVILVDDGLASGFTMLVAVRAVKKMGSKRIVIATPTSSINAIRLLSNQIDLILCLNMRSTAFFAVADAYQEWHDLTDEEVKSLLKDVREKDSKSQS